MSQNAEVGTTTYWIKTSTDNLEFLQSIGVEVGERLVDHWTGCTIPDDLESWNDLFEYWGHGDGDTIMFGKEGLQGSECFRQIEAGTFGLKKDFSKRKARPREAVVP